jgi:uncharacterized membrane protein YfcA
MSLCRASVQGKAVDLVTLGVIGVVFLASLVRGFLGFGNALVAMPLLALFMDIETVTPLVALLAFLKAMIMLAQSWRDICLRSAWRMIAATAFGTPIGLIFLKGAHESVVQFVLAVVIALFSLYSLFHPTLIRLKSDRGAFVAGFCAGVLGGAYNTNGPPIVMYGAMRGWDPAKFRATLQGFFLPAGILILIGHAAAGLWTAEVFRYLAWSAPVVVVTLLVSHKLSRRLPTGNFDKLVHGMLLIIAAMLAVKAVT